jgi:hypothetical protein
MRHVVAFTNVGNSPKALEHPHPIPFFLGITLGVLVGSIPLLVPGLPAAVKLGLAGGPLVVAILLARLANTGSLVWHLPPSSNLALREIGITRFLAAVGIKSRPGRGLRRRLSLRHAPARLLRPAAGLPALARGQRRLITAVQSVRILTADYADERGYWFIREYQRYPRLKIPVPKV